MQSFWTLRLRSAFVRLVVVFALVVATSGLGHAGSHAPDHALSNVVYEHSLISDHEANHCESRAASGDCEAQAHPVEEHQASVECCDGVCMSFVPPQLRESAACVETSEIFSQAAEFEPSAGALANLRPPRKFI